LAGPAAPEEDVLPLKTLREKRGCLPLVLQTDNGSAYCLGEVERLLEQENVVHLRHSYQAGLLLASTAIKLNGNRLRGRRGYRTPNEMVKGLPLWYNRITSPDFSQRLRPRSRWTVRSSGEGGGQLSGGQRQRVAIARAIIANPALLLLDEATSALDPGTALSITQALARIAKGRTVIAVTHRLESAVSADLVFVFDEGRLVEQGHHEQLLQNNGHYARMWRKQTGFSIDQKGNAEVEVTRLRDIPIFNKLDDTLLTRMAQLFSTEHYVPDRVVIHEGDLGDRFYIIVRGQVGVSRRLPQGGSEQFQVLEAGDYFGEVALLRKAPRIGTARTLSDCTLLSLADEHFQRLMQDAPKLLEEMKEAIEEALRLPEYEWAARIIRPEPM
jgi:hypothetical protein